MTELSYLAGFGNQFQSEAVPGALPQGIGITALADTGDAGIGFHGDDRIRLVEQRIRIRRRVREYPHDLHLRQRGVQ